MSEADLKKMYAPNLTGAQDEARERIEVAIEVIDAALDALKWDLTDREWALIDILKSAMHWADFQDIDFMSCLEEASGIHFVERSALRLGDVTPDEESF